jgi:hypothetical protein
MMSNCQSDSSICTKVAYSNCAAPTEGSNPIEAGIYKPELPLGLQRAAKNGARHVSRSGCQQAVLCLPLALNRCCCGCHCGSLASGARTCPQCLRGKGMCGQQACVRGDKNVTCTADHNPANAGPLLHSLLWLSDALSAASCSMAVRRLMASASCPSSALNTSRLTATRMPCHSPSYTTPGAGGSAGGAMGWAKQCESVCVSGAGDGICKTSCNKVINSTTQLTK